jgi:hypothetical protein
MELVGQTRRLDLNLIDGISGENTEIGPESDRWN